MGEHVDVLSGRDEVLEPRDGSETLERRRRIHDDGRTNSGARAYFTVDTGGNNSDTRGVRGRARVRIIDGDIGLAIDVTRKALVKYMGTDTGPYADEMLKWARDGGMSVVELTPLRFGAFGY